MASLPGDLLRLIRGFQSDRIGQLVICKQLSVAVVNIAPGTVGFNGFFHFIIKVIKMLLSLHDLEDKQAVYQQAE